MRAAGENGYVRPAGQFHQLEAIGDRVVEADIAGRGDQPQHVEGLPLAKNHQDGGGLVLAGIGEDDELARHAATLPGAPPSSQA